MRGRDFGEIESRDQKKEKRYKFILLKLMQIN